MFYLVDKPVGISSFFTLGKIKFILQAKKIGHTGTLDPLASGLLIVATEGSTKLIPFLDKARKTYEFSVDFSRESPSCDLGSEVTSLPAEILEFARKHMTATQIQAILPSFRGKITQVPPIYSAVRIDGKRAYTMARKGTPVEINPREVEVFSLELLDFNFPIARFRAEVSAGTYIRSIGRDIGRALSVVLADISGVTSSGPNCFADVPSEEPHRVSQEAEIPKKNPIVSLSDAQEKDGSSISQARLGGIITELRRTKIADWSVEDATPRNEITPETKPIPYEVLFPDFGILEVEEASRELLKNGNPLPLSAYRIVREASNGAPWFIKMDGIFSFLGEIQDETVIPNRGNIG